MALSRRMTGSPEVCLPDFLGNHLQVVKLLARRRTVFAEQLQHAVV
jgi:hypothetical protein